MKFKHTFHVFVDNFKVIYKQLLYRLVLSVVACALYGLCLYPLVNRITGSEAFIELFEGIGQFIQDFLSGNFNDLPLISEGVQKAFVDLMELFRTELGKIALTAFLLILVHIVEKWFAGMGNFAAAVVINDKMSLRADSHFLVSLVRNLKKAAIYNAIYAPLSVLYDLVVCVAMFFLMYFLVVHSVLPFFLAVFLFVLIVVIAISFKMVFTTDWLPALIRGRMGQKEAFVYTFSRKNKNTLNVLSNFVVLILIVFGVNVLAILGTFGVAALLTVPSGYIVIICFEMVNYFDREEIKYSVDNNTIVKPSKEQPLTREEFFRGEDE